jgi:hypothetical protein
MAELDTKRERLPLVPRKLELDIKFQWPKDLGEEFLGYAIPLIVDGLKGVIETIILEETNDDLLLTLDDLKNSLEIVILFEADIKGKVILSHLFLAVKGENVSLFPLTGYGFTPLDAFLSLLEDVLAENYFRLLLGLNEEEEGDGGEA